MWQKTTVSGYRIFLVCLFLASNGLPGAWAAPILGSNQTEPDLEADQALNLDTGESPAADIPVGNPSATVVEFSLVPSISDPSKIETIIFLQQGGGRKVCVNLNNDEIIARSYIKRGDETFVPAIPSEIRGLTSGHSGDVTGYTGSKIFIRPHSPEDDFADLNECFVAGEAEGCFIVGEEDCDQELVEGELLCVGDGISNSGCPVAEHANLTRQMRIMVALNQPPGEAPIITAADLARAPELAIPNGDAEGDLPSGPAPAGPTAAIIIGGGGGGGGGALIPVPNVIGLTLEQASVAITSVGLFVGGGHDSDSNRVANRHDCPPGERTGSPVGNQPDPAGWHAGAAGHSRQCRSVGSGGGHTRTLHTGAVRHGS
jgi:hypothetical protein